MRRLLDQKCPVTTFSRKQRAIFENVEAGHVEQLYRIVADFSGPYAELCAFAVERFLICSVYGVHRLANDTQGDSKWSVRDRREAQCDWLCKPRSDNAELETVWLRVGNDFVSEGRLLQKASNDLKLLITESWIAGIRNQLEPLERRGLDYIGFGNNGADVSVEWHIRGLPIRIQLVFSSKCTDVGINLRPRVSKWCAEPSQEDRIAFEEYVAVRLPRPGTVALQIKIPDSRNCFVKPYSEGNLHPRFDIANSAAVVSVRSLLEDKRLELNFTDAMTHLLDALLTQDACSKGG